MHFAKNTTALALILSLFIVVISSVSPIVTQMTLIGSVYAQSNVPIKGATVTVTGANASAVSTTDSAGNFQITSGLGTGTCSVTVTATGYLDAMVSNVLITAGSTTVTIPPLKRSGVISGIVSSGSTGPPPPPPT